MGRGKVGGKNRRKRINSRKEKNKFRRGPTPREMNEEEDAGEKEEGKEGKMKRRRISIKENEGNNPKRRLGKFGNQAIPY